MTRKAGTRSFIADELQASVYSGCRSCEVFGLIFSQIFPEYKGITDDSIVCTYTISNEFILCQYLETNRATSLKRVQLFHPYGKSISKATKTLLIFDRLASPTNQPQCLGFPRWKSNFGAKARSMAGSM